MKDTSLNRPGSSESYQKLYRDTVTRPKMVRAERYITECPVLGNCADRVMPDVAAHFELASENPSQVVPHIHDLWAEYVFRSAEYAERSARSALLRNHFLKPLGDFTNTERRFEETLAIRDLRTLAAIAEGVIMHDSIASGEMAASIACPQNVIIALARLAAMDSFLKTAAKSIHENWLRTRRAFGMDVPSESRYENMPNSVLQRLLANVRADVLAALLFCEEYYADGPRNSAKHLSPADA
jgi:hypothetical protein